MSDFQLSSGDKVSEAWLRLKGHLKAERAALRERNDNQQSPEDTAFLRGRIAQLTEILALDPERE